LLGGSIYSSFSSVTPLPALDDSGNGVLSVHVLNTLTVPGTVVADVKVNVFVSMLDDFEVAAPNNRISYYRIRNVANPVAEMGVPEMAEGDNMKDMDCCDDPVSDPVTIDRMADNLIENSDTTKVYFGEVIASFRQLIKRTCLSEVVTLDDLDTSTFVSIFRRSYPEHGGRLPDTTAPFSSSMVIRYANGQYHLPTSTNFINYVGMMFLGWRGSIRWTFDTSSLNVSGGGDRFNSITAIIARQRNSARRTVVERLKIASEPLHNVGITLLNDEAELSIYGNVIGNTNVNPIISAEVPFYANERFHMTHHNDSFGDFPREPSYIFKAVIPGTASDDDVSFIRLYCSAGEDLNFFFFNGLPPLFYQPTIATDPGA
jgi:hypothetical protein